MKKNQQIRNSTTEFLIFAMQGDAEGIEVRLEDDTVWLTQQMLAELYGTTKQNISLHILNIYEEEELSRESTVKDFLTVRNEGNLKVNRRLDVSWIPAESAQYWLVIGSKFVKFEPKVNENEPKETLIE